MANVTEQRPASYGGTHVARIVQAAAILSALVAAAFVLHIARHGFGLWRAAGVAFFAYCAVQAHWNARTIRDSAAIARAFEDHHKRHGT